MRSHLDPMKLYFTLGSVPELADLPPHERRLVYYACRKRMRGSALVWTASIAGLLIGAALGAGLVKFILDWRPFPLLWNYFAGGVPWGALMIAGWEIGRTLAIINLVGPYARDLLAAQHPDAQKTDAGRVEPEKTEPEKKMEIDYLRAPFEESHAANDKNTRN